MPKGLTQISLLTVFALSLVFGVAAPQQAQIKKSPNLVYVPVIVSDATGRYIADLQQSDFEVVEDGVKQKVTGFMRASEPASIVLLLDTSVSTQEKLGDIRRAAVSFVDQLPKTDRVKLVTFDDQIRELTEFSADRGVLKKAIANIQPGYGTKFYDGMNVALESLREVEGRKAIVLFSDGVDYRSDYASAEGTLRSLEQDGIVVYAIRFSTRVAAECLAREQAGQSQLPTREVAKSTGPEQRNPDEIPSSQPRTGPLGFPSPEEIIRRRRDSDRTRDRLPPADRPPTGEIGADLPTGRSDPRVSSKSRDRKGSQEDPIKANLDRLYSTADTYLQTAAEKSGGQLLRADEVSALPGAFSQVVAQLSAQYFLSYEPSNKARDDKYHALIVTTSRPGLTIRARGGYRQ
jgi:VWFA-related protein